MKLDGVIRPAACCGERCVAVAVAGGNVEHALAGAKVECLTKRFTDDLQRPDDGVVAGGPRGMLSGLDGAKIDWGGETVSFMAILLMTGRTRLYQG